MNLCAQFCQFVRNTGKALRVPWTNNQPYIRQFSPCFHKSIPNRPLLCRMRTASKDDDVARRRAAHTRSDARIQHHHEVEDPARQVRVLKQNVTLGETQRPLVARQILTGPHLDLASFGSRFQDPALQRRIAASLRKAGLN